MPYTLRVKPGPRHRSRKCYQVLNRKNRKMAQCTTKRRALRQLNLLRAIEHGWKVPPKTGRRRRR
jgi:hypothetical protein